MNEREVIKLLAERYLKLLGFGKDQQLRNMCLTIINKYQEYPEGKLNRWLGYIQRGVIDLKLTTLAKESRFAKPLFDKLYIASKPVEESTDQKPNE